MKNKVTIKESRKTADKKAGLCAAVFFALCMFTGCGNTDKPIQTADNPTAVPKQEYPTESVTSTPETQGVQTQPTASNTEVLQTKMPTPTQDIQSVQPKETAASSNIPNETENPQSIEPTQKGKPQKGSKGKIVNKALGFTIQFSEELSEKIRYTSDLKQQDDDFQAELQYIEFYTKLEEKKQVLFIIYRINQKMTEAEVGDVNPGMGYLGCSDSATYTIGYITEPKSGLSREGEQEFESLMGKAVREVSETFKITE